MVKSYMFISKNLCEFWITEDRYLPMDSNFFILPFGRFGTDANIKAACTIVSTEAWDSYTVITTTGR